MIKIDNIETYGWEAAIRGMRPIPNHYGFMACSDGTIIGKRGKPMKGHVDRCGYREVMFSENGSSSQYRVHRLIAETFIPNPENLPFVNHIDGNKLNNDVSNLEWCTRSQNAKHAYDTGLERKVFGMEHHASKFTDDQIREIRREYIPRDREHGAAAIARRYGVDRTTIADIVNRVTWREVA